MRYYSRKALEDYMGNIGLNGHFLLDDLDACKIPSIDIPEPHGPLKDVNKIIEDIKKHYYHNSRFCDERCSCCDFAEIISVIERDIPTVLEVSN